MNKATAQLILGLGAGLWASTILPFDNIIGLILVGVGLFGLFM